MKGTHGKLGDYLLMTLGTALISIDVYFFEVTNGFMLGGVSGIGIMLSRFTPLPASVWIALLGMVLLIVGVIFLGKSFGIKTFYCSILYSSILALLEWIAPISEPLTAEPLLELIYIIVLNSLGAAMVFRAGATSGGTDIVAMILTKYTSLDVGKALFAVDVLIALSSFFLFGITVGLFSFAGLLARAFLVDGVTDMMNQSKYFMIVTTRAEEISSFITGELDRGATVATAKGAYTGEEKAVLHVVCSRREAARLGREVRRIDPAAFIVITSSSEIIGAGFRSPYIRV